MPIITGNYKVVLESYSHPILELIEWEITPDHNVVVLNDTIDYYRYLDATKQAEFLFDCVMDTINRIIPEEVSYIYDYDEFKRFIVDLLHNPNNLVMIFIAKLAQYNTSG